MFPQLAKGGIAVTVKTDLDDGNGMQTVETVLDLELNHCTIEDFCNKIHRTIIKELKHALVWGTSVKHQPQRVGKDHLLHDEDVVQIVKNVK